MGLFSKKQKTDPEMLEAYNSSNINYLPIMGQLSSKRNNYQANLETYKIMEQDALIAGALELWASDATQTDSDKAHSVWIECSNPNLKAELEDFLYNVLDIESKLFAWGYKIARDGQLFLRTFDSAKYKDWTFEAVRANEKVYPLYEKGAIVKYYYENEKGEGNIYPEKEFIPFISSLDEEYDKITLRLQDGSGKEVQYDCIHGESFLRGAVLAWKVLTTMEEVLILARVGKSSVYNLVRIEVGNASKKEADNIIAKAKKVFKTAEAINLVDNMYKSKNQPIAANENIYIPTRNGVGNMSVETVGGNYELKSALDLDYFRNKLFAALHIPKTYLGFDGGEQTGVLGDNSLARLDERYARTCKRLQRVLRNGVQKICQYYLESTGRNLNMVPPFKICMTGISSVEEKTRREEFGAKLDNAQKLVDLALTNFPNQVDKGSLFTYVFGNMLGISVEDFSTAVQSEIPVKNLGLRGTGFGDPEDFTTRKFITVHGASSVDTSSINDSYDIWLEAGGSSVPLREHFQASEKRLKRVLDEATYSDLKQKVQLTDPDRIRKAKKLTIAYLGINRNGDIMFKCSSGTTPGKFWYQTIRLLDLPKAIEEFGKDGTITDKEIVGLAVHGDIAVYCNDPSFKYYGWQWMADQGDYGIEPENRAPTRNNTEHKGALCKHLYLALHVLPFWTNKIVSDLRKQFFRMKPTDVKAPHKVTDPAGRAQPWSHNKGDGDMLRSLPKGNEEPVDNTLSKEDLNNG